MVVEAVVIGVVLVVVFMVELAMGVVGLVVVATGTDMGVLLE
jgi:hypothetical protein